MTQESEILETLKVILKRLDDIEEKLDQVNNPYNINYDTLSTNNNMPDGYTLINMV